MKTRIIGCVMVVFLSLLAPTILPAQGTITFLSNLDQVSAGSLAVGSNSWLAALFRTGNNTGGYVLNSIQLEMMDGVGAPANFTAMLYTINPVTPVPGQNLGTLTGSLNPATSGTFSYNPASTQILSPSTYYFIVLTAGTAIANGAYEWSYANSSAYNPNGGWTSFGGTLTSTDGASWNSMANDFSQFAISATPIPEPDVVGLLGVGNLAFLWHRRRARAN